MKVMIKCKQCNQNNRFDQEKLLASSCALCGERIFNSQEQVDTYLKDVLSNSKDNLGEPKPREEEKKTFNSQVHFYGKGHRIKIIEDESIEYFQKMIDGFLDKDFYIVDIKFSHLKYFDKDYNKLIDNYTAMVIYLDL